MIRYTLDSCTLHPITAPAPTPSPNWPRSHNSEFLQTTDGVNSFYCRLQVLQCAVAILLVHEYQFTQEMSVCCPILHIYGLIFQDFFHLFHEFELTLNFAFPCIRTATVFVFNEVCAVQCTSLGSLEQRRGILGAAILYLQHICTEIPNSPPSWVE